MIKDINMPLFLMNIPTCYSTNVRNNIWMEEYTAKDIVVNKEKLLERYGKYTHSFQVRVLFIFCPHLTIADYKIWFLLQIME